MNIEKLIEQLNGYFEGKELKRGTALEAATTLSTLQAENEKLRAELEQVKQERDAAVGFLRSVIRHSTNPCEGCKADCIDAGSDAAERVDQCGTFEWRGPKEGETMKGYTNITMFDKPYPPEKQAEGLAISQAIVGGHCAKCGFLPQCSTQDDFMFPVFAWCMKRKAEILKEMEG